MAPRVAVLTLRHQQQSAQNAARKGCEYQNQGANVMYFSVAGTPTTANSIKVYPATATNTGMFYCSQLGSSITMTDAISISGTSGDAFAGQWQ